MGLARRRLMVLAVPGVAAVGVSGVAVTRAAAAASAGADHVPAPDLGIAPGNSAATNRANLIAALSNSAVCVVFPPGDYLVDNGGAHAPIRGFGGELVFRPGARLLFTDNTRSGIIFDDATGPALYGLSTSFVSRPPARIAAEECVLFRNVDDPYVEDVRIDGSAAAGLLFFRCVRPTVVGALITNTMADGLHFANCQDGRADRITTVDTGDDGVAFVNYASGPDRTGGLATNISVTRSRARGVAVVGQSGATVRDVSIDQTESHGLLCAYEAGLSRVPTDVSFERVRVNRGGAWQPSGGSPFPGVSLAEVGAVTLARITVDEPGGRGVNAVGGPVTLTDVTVRNGPSSGFNLQRGSYLLDRLTAENTGGIGFFANGCERVEYGTILLRNTSRTATLRRAVNVENNGYVVGERLWIYDTQATATGYIVGAYGAQRGSLGLVVDRVDSRDVVVENPSGLSLSRL